LFVALVGGIQSDDGATPAWRSAPPKQCGYDSTLQRKLVVNVVESLSIPLHTVFATKPLPFTVRTKSPLLELIWEGEREKIRGARIALKVLP